MLFRSESLKTTFVSRIFGGVRAVRPQDVANDLRRDTDSDAHQYEEQDRQVLFNIHTVKSFGLGPMTNLHLGPLSSGAVGETRTRTAFATTTSR